MLHETPAHFGKENAQSIMGIQMACAYIGSTLSPPVFGWIASNTTVSLLPIFILGCGVCMIICMEKINLFMRNNTV